MRCSGESKVEGDNTSNPGKEIIELWWNRVWDLDPRSQIVWKIVLRCKTEMV